MTLTIVPEGGGEAFVYARSAPTIALVTAPGGTGLTYTGVSGPRGERGERGPAGPVGSIDGEAVPDLALIFDNKLI